MAYRKDFDIYLPLIIDGVAIAEDLECRIECMCKVDPEDMLIERIVIGGKEGKANLVTKPSNGGGTIQDKLYNILAPLAYYEVGSDFVEAYYEEVEAA